MLFLQNFSEASCLFFVLIPSTRARPADVYSVPSLDSDMTSSPRWIDEPGGFRHRGVNDSVILNTKLRNKVISISKRQTLHAEYQEEMLPSETGSQPAHKDYRSLDPRDNPSGFISSLLFATGASSPSFASSTSPMSIPQKTSINEMGHETSASQSQGSTMLQGATPSSILLSTPSEPTSSSFPYNPKRENEGIFTVIRPSGGESPDEAEYKHPAWNIVQCLVYNWSPEWPGLADDAKRAYSRCVGIEEKQTFRSSSTPFPTSLTPATVVPTSTSGVSTQSMMFNEDAMRRTTENTATSSAPSQTLLEPSTTMSIYDGIASYSHLRTPSDSAEEVGGSSVSEVQDADTMM